jgi:hypothetical protein
MHRFAEAKVAALAHQGLDGLLKQGSPSCGLLDVPVHGSAVGRGIFAAALASRMPELPVEEESRFADPGVRTRLVERAIGRFIARCAGRIDPARLEDYVARLLDSVLTPR